MDIPDDGVGPRNIDVCVVGSTELQPTVIVRTVSRTSPCRNFIVPLAALCTG
jgi:hypothetical protein